MSPTSKANSARAAETAAECGCAVRDASASSRHAAAVDPELKSKNIKRLRRIEGQARGLQKMIEEEQYCIDILTQVSAMTRALQSVALGLLGEHLSHCVVRAAAEGGAEANIKIEEASNAIARLVRS